MSKRLVFIPLAILAFAPVLALSLQPAQPAGSVEGLNGADVAWMLVATSMVLFSSSEST